MKVNNNHSRVIYNQETLMESQATILHTNLITEEHPRKMSTKNNEFKKIKDLASSNRKNTIPLRPMD